VCGIGSYPRISGADANDLVPKQCTCRKLAQAGWDVLEGLNNKALFRVRVKGWDGAYVPMSHMTFQVYRVIVKMESLKTDDSYKLLDSREHCGWFLRRAR
jgi:hypothetical protein